MGSSPKFYNENLLVVDFDFLGRKIILYGGGIEYLHRSPTRVGGDEKGCLESETANYGSGERQQQL
jgi:hypothetical protein